MDKILDIRELVQEDKKCEDVKLKIFAEILTACHALIRRYNAPPYRKKELVYQIPQFIYGKPRYDIDVLRNYLIYHLSDNGLKVVALKDYQIYVSWKETDINLSKFIKRKQTVKMHRPELAETEECAAVKPTPRNSDSFINMLRFRQARQRQIQDERQERFRKQNMPSNFQDYISRY
jgi:hypothetical protein